VFDGQAVVVPQAAAGVDDGLVVDQDRADAGVAGQVEGDLAGPAGAQRVGRDAGDRDVHGGADAQGLVQGGGRGRFDRDDAAGVAQGRDDPGDQAAAAHGHQDRVEAGGELVEQFQAQRSVAGDHLRVVVGVAEQRPGLAGPDDGGRVRLGVLVAHLDHPGAEPAQLRDLDRWGVHRHEDLGRHRELARRVGRGQAGVASGRGDDTGFREGAGGEDLVEHASGLERAGVLGVLQLEPDRVVGPQDGGVPDAVADPVRCCPYIVGGNHRFGL
jgi:hypothetical protein